MASDGYWEERGAILLGSMDGAIGTEDDMLRASYQTSMGVSTGQFCATAIINGNETEAPLGAQSGQHPPILRITAGVYLTPTGQVDTVGMRGLQAHDVLGTKAVGHVSLVQIPPDTDPWVGEVPPYPVTLDFKRVWLDFGNGAWSDGSPTWRGTYEFYLYDLPANASSGEPGRGVDDPLVCPARPEWPYKDPVQSVGSPGPARIRRSRP